MHNGEAYYPLQGIKVVELATVIAAPAAARLLSDFGAEVIKVEPLQGDFLRDTGYGHALPIDVGNNPLFDMVNSNKKLLALDLKKPAGMRIMKELLAEADIFISNIRMPSLQKMGLDYDTLHAEFPQLIYGHFSGFGTKGAECNKPGFDSSAFWMRSGAMLDTLPPGSFPLRPSFAFGDLSSASSFASGMLMALYARTQGKGGSYISTSLLNCGLWYNSTYLVNSQEKYGRQYPLDRYEPWDPFADSYQCADGEWVGIFEKQYVKDRYVFAEIFDLPELVEDPDMATLPAMTASGKKPGIVRKVEEKMAQKTSDEWMQIFKERDISTERLRHFKEVPSDAQAWENGYFEAVDYGDGAETVFPTPPMQFSAYGRKAFCPAGDVGQDTEAVLSAMGYTAEEMAALRAAKVIG